ncbi:hypothetical protein N0V88_002683 [Collariella sp. IMI 366227]|nr:hypothetical protein N0V88_002683 [Collariella sp. IMI 366227]
MAEHQRHIEIDTDRLHLTHDLLTKGIGNRLFLSPIASEKLQRVLDIGTGAGISGAPSNVKFRGDDIEAPWNFKAPFDFIFSRYMLATIKDWPAMVQKVHGNLNPGGWAEFQDFNVEYYSEDGSLKADSAIIKWTKSLNAAAYAAGRDPCPGSKLEGWVRDAGFVNVTHHKFRFPIGDWPKDPHLKTVGKLNLMQVLQGPVAFSLRLFVDVMKWEQDEVTTLLANVRKELMDRKVHPQVDFHVVYGQKKE